MRFLIYIDTPEKQSLQVVVNQIMTKLSSALSGAAAAGGATSAEVMEAMLIRELLKYSVVVITALPFCLLYPFVQRYFNTGVMIGAVKE